MRLLLALGVLALVLATHPALAESTGALVFFEGHAYFPLTTLKARPLALFLNGTSELLDLTLRADALTVHVNRIDYACAGASPINLLVPTSNHRADFPLTDVTLRLASPTTHATWPGWLGAYPAATATLEAATPSLQLAPRAHSLLGNNPNPEVAPAPNRNFYSRLVDAPHLAGNAAGTFTLHGAGGLKLNGPTVEVHARENATTYATGEQNPSPGLCTARWEWVHFEYDYATVTLTTATPADFAIDDAALTWNGTARLDGATGTILTPAGPRPASSTAVLDGGFTGTLTPFSDGTDATALLRAEALLRPEPPTSAGWRVSAPAVGLQGPILALVAVVAIASSAAVTHVVAQRVGAVPSYRRFAAFYSKPGEAAFWYADLLLNSFRMRNRAARYLIRALREDPALAGPVELHGPFAPLLNQPRVRRALDRAWGREQGEDRP